MRVTVRPQREVVSCQFRSMRCGVGACSTGGSKWQCGTLERVILCQHGNFCCVKTREKFIVHKQLDKKSDSFYEGFLLEFVRVLDTLNGRDRPIFPHFFYRKQPNILYALKRPRTGHLKVKNGCEASTPAAEKLPGLGSGGDVPPRWGPFLWQQNREGNVGGKDGSGTGKKRRKLSREKKNKDSSEMVNLHRAGQNNSVRKSPTSPPPPPYHHRPSPYNFGRTRTLKLPRGRS